MFPGERKEGRLEECGGKGGSTEGREGELGRSGRGKGGEKEVGRGGRREGLVEQREGGRKIEAGKGRGEGVIALP